MARKTTPAQDSSPVADFEQSMQSLEDLVARMETGEMTLEESLAAYERGVPNTARAPLLLRVAMYSSSNRL